MDQAANLPDARYQAVRHTLTSAACSEAVSALTCLLACSNHTPPATPMAAQPVHTQPQGGQVCCCCVPDLASNLQAAFCTIQATGCLWLQKQKRTQGSSGLGCAARSSANGASHAPECLPNPAHAGNPAQPAQNLRGTPAVLSSEPAHALAQQLAPCQASSRMPWWKAIL